MGLQMSEWPEGWFREGSGAGTPDGSAAGDPTIRVPGPGGTAGGGAGGASGAGQQGGGSGGYPGGGSGAASGWPQQPARGAAGGGGTGERRRRHGWLRPRRILGVLAVLVVLVLIATTGTYFYLNSKLVRQDVLVNYAGRPAAGAGQNWLIAGSDGRQGLTRKEERQLHTGRLSAISGQRSDTIMILHIPSNGGRPVLVSIPRDSYVPIPGYGSSKINAAFDFGGPRLLAETVQNATGLYINHYMGIGFGGFVTVVNDVGGVDLCLPGKMVDPLSGLHLKAGCQTLDGPQALAFVRSRNFPLADLQREQDQRVFLKALLSKMTSMGTVLNPFAAIPAATGTAESLTVDQGTSLYQLIQVAFALRNPETTTVPLATIDYPTSDGIAVLWNRPRALRLFNALRTDAPVPRSLITGSKIEPTGA
jgi:LCP family protein required for cell wall assembly